MQYSEMSESAKTLLHEMMSLTSDLNFLAREQQTLIDRLQIAAERTARELTYCYDNELIRATSMVSYVKGVDNNVVDIIQRAGEIERRRAVIAVLRKVVSAEELAAVDAMMSK